MLRKGHKLHALLHSADLIEQHLRIELEPLGLRPRQARVLNALGHAGTSSQIELARAFNVSPASMSTMTQRLVEGGYILRSEDPKERRTNTLELTEKGRALLSDVRKAWANVDKIIETAIGKDKAEALAERAFELRNALGGHPPAKALARRSAGADKAPRKT
ncbi:MarR family winged helix-turn-helix transcriptional regulator [Roseobacter sinensis]|uniref:MarR family transcriptional regulator n=1 Tax=Roseobacter sinensis TaxID=2931391 RepID=A0ABT3B9B5_9RHOB|nr:MarR family transcriptional regulator [Roseobacter sp. WL0113]MCV3270169.1 MarR family transcriptional regulator [Roseobacter sp. WL0113]